MKKKLFVAVSLFAFDEFGKLIGKLDADSVDHRHFNGSWINEKNMREAFGETLTVKEKRPDRVFALIQGVDAPVEPEAA